MPRKLRKHRRARYAVVEIRRRSAAEGDNTTHFSVVDRYGNAVSNTYTLNSSYGVGLIAEGTGVLLNNELDDFTAKPGAQCLRPGRRDANAPAPRKRPLSSMTPDHRAQGRQAVARHRLARRQPHHLDGAAGGRELLDFNSVADALGAAHPSSMAARSVAVEPGFRRTCSPRWRRAATRSTRRPSTSANSISVTPHGYVGAADPRTRGALAAGY